MPIDNKKRFFFLNKSNKNLNKCFYIFFKHLNFKKTQFTTKKNKKLPKVTHYQDYKCKNVKWKIYRNWENQHCIFMVLGTWKFWGIRISNVKSWCFPMPKQLRISGNASCVHMRVCQCKKHQHRWKFSYSLLCPGACATCSATGAEKCRDVIKIFMLQTICVYEALLFGE